jgi:hypothetical protein
VKERRGEGCLRISSDLGRPILEREFRALYQEPNVRYAMFGTLLAVVGFGGFHLMDVAAGRVPALDWAGAARFVLTSIFVLATYIVFHYQDFVHSLLHPARQCVLSGGRARSALLPIAVYGVESPVELYWSLNASLVTATVVIYGFSRLTARNTALVVFLRLRHRPRDRGAFARLRPVLLRSAGLASRHRERRLVLAPAKHRAPRATALPSRPGEPAQEHLRAGAGGGKDAGGRGRQGEDALPGEHEPRVPHAHERRGANARSRASDSDRRDGEAGGTGHRLEQRIPRTINSILDYTRWSQDVVPVSISTVGLGGLVRRVVARHSAEISRRGLALHLRLDLTDSEDFVKTDAVMLAEVLGRLLANAVKFTPAGRIDLGVELRRRPEAGPTGVSIEASVVDTGIGIPTRSDHGSGRRSIRSTTPATGRKAEPGWVWRSSRSWCRPSGGRGAFPVSREAEPKFA